MAQISNTEGGESLSDTFLLKIVRTTRLSRRFAAEKWDYSLRMVLNTGCRMGLGCSWIVVPITSPFSL